jgi:hypothetical protein
MVPTKFYSTQRPVKLASLTLNVLLLHLLTISVPLSPAAIYILYNLRWLHVAAGLGGIEMAHG